MPQVRAKPKKEPVIVSLLAPPLFPELKRTGTQRPLKIVVFPLTWVLAHVGRTVEIAKELRARGHEVVFAGEDASHPSSRLSHAEKNGFRVVKVKEPQWHWAWERFQKHGWHVSFLDFLRHQRWAPLDEIVEDIIRVAKEEQPDLILGDASLGVSTAGHILGIPAAGVLNAYNAQFFRDGSLYKGIIQTMNRMHWAPIRARVYARHGVAPVNAIELLRNTPLLSPDLVELHAPLAEYPNWHAIGPLVSEPPFPLPGWYDDLKDDTTNVYITMGSTGLLEPLLTRCYDAMGRAPYRFVVTTGGQMSEAAMAAAPPNFRFAKYAPGSALLKHCKAMVFHGGNGSMYQALAAGVPMLALPSHLEQHVSCTALQREGFGFKASARRIKGPALVQKITQIIEEPSYAWNAMRLRGSVLKSDGPARAADMLEAHARAGARAQAAV